MKTAFISASIASAARLRGQMTRIILRILFLTSLGLFAKAGVASEKTLPKVLLIGDSISKGYTPYVIEMMKDQAIVTHHKGNAGPTMRGLENMDEWLAVDQWDLIHFNWGLHDMYRWNYQEDERSPAAYEKRLDILVSSLVKTGAKLIWATTTPACPEAEQKCKVIVDAVTERKYLEGAARVMKKHNIPVNDLNTFMVSNWKTYSIAEDNVHYTPTGSKKLAEQVVAKVSALLNSTSSIEEDITKRLGNYGDYQTSEIFSAGNAEVRIKAFNELGWHVVVIPEKKGSEKGVTLKMKDAPSMEGYTFTPEIPGYAYWRETGDSVDLATMPEGWGWYFLRKPLALSSPRKPGPEHMITTKKTVIKRAKYPVVDVHTHVLLSFKNPALYLRLLDQAGVAVLVDSPLATFTQRTKDTYSKMEALHPNRFITFGTIDFSNRYQDGFSDAAIAALEADVKTMGIAGVGETHDKGAGVYGHALRPDPRGRVHLDDDRIMPIWRAAARLKLPILFHIAEPIGNYAPFGEHPFERWGNVSRKYNLWGTSVLSHHEMMLRRNSLMQDIPDLVIIGAHMGSLENDLQRLGDTFDKYPNFYVEIGQRHITLGQQPNLARKFFIKYQDRILFGQDGVQTLETYRNHFRFLETDDDLINFSSRRPPVYGLKLPDEVLRKVYYGNAAKLIPKVKKALQNQYPDLKFP